MINILSISYLFEVQFFFISKYELQWNTGYKYKFYLKQAYLTTKNIAIIF